MLAVEQLRGKSTYLWAERTAGAAGLGREVGHRLGPATAPQPVGDVVGHGRHDRGEVDDLADLLPTTSAPAKSAPQASQHAGACSATASARRRCRFAPGAPGCFPRLRFSALASARRSALFLRGPIGSEDGGLPVVEEPAFSCSSKRETLLPSNSFSALTTSFSVRNCSIVLRASRSWSRNDALGHTIGSNRWWALSGGILAPTRDRGT